MTRDKRFKWTFVRNVICGFEDRQYFSPSFRYHDEKSARLVKIKSSIIKKEAEAIARNALYKPVNMTEKQLGYRNRVEVNQYKLEESNGESICCHCLMSLGVWRDQNGIRPRIFNARRCAWKFLASRRKWSITRMRST